MSYEIKRGIGEIGDVEISGGLYTKINSYARVTKIENNTATIDNVLEGDFEKFRAGVDCLIHVSATNRNDALHLGKYITAKIILAQNNILTFNENVADYFSGVDFDYEYLQAVTIPDFDCLKLKTDAIISPPPFNPFTFNGGILIIRCFNELSFEGGHINLVDCGIPYNRKNSLRPLTEQETPSRGQTDAGRLAGQENFITADRFLLNAGDGACMILAKKLNLTQKSRIGSFETHGMQRSRAAADSPVKPSNVTNIGGSTILIAADSILNFSPQNIAKYRNANLPEGRGLARCFIASNSILPVDEGLYAFDILADKDLVRNLGVVDFGDGSLGDCYNPNIQLNNYASINATTHHGHKIFYSDKTVNGLAPLTQGALVILQNIQKTNFSAAGKITVARVLADAGDFLVVDSPFFLDEGCTGQIISVPQFRNLTIDSDYRLTKKFDGNGGVLAVAVADSFDLSNGKLNVEGKGGAVAYGRAGLNFIGNSQNFNRLPLGSGHGSVFILAKELILNENSRIGALYSGDNPAGGNNLDDTNAGGGYSGGFDENKMGSGSGFIGGGAFGGLGGSGFGGGTSSNSFDFAAEVGGYGSNGTDGLHGAHIFIVADSILNFYLSAISTGGSPATGANPGSASHGGGGNPVHSGGSGAFAFIFANS